MKKTHAEVIFEELARLYPGDNKDLCELDFKTPFQLVVAAILSAQSTDKQINKITPKLFESYPDAQAMAGARIEDVEQLVKSSGFFRNKAKNIVGLAVDITDNYGGELPTSVDELTQLPGVGRKTANVVRAVAFDLPGLAVDTHVKRLANLLGLSKNQDPEKIEKDLIQLIDENNWGAFSLRLVLHGRRICIARRPKCDQCALATLCPSAQTS